MRTVSERWRQASSGVVQWTTLVDWSNDGGAHWHPATFVSGSVTADSTSQTRWSTSDLILSDVPTEEADPDALNPFTSRLRVRHGIQWSATETDRELLGMGIYRVAQVDDESDSDTVTVSGASFEQYLIASRFPAARKLPAENADSRVERLITEVLPKATIWWDRIEPEFLPTITADRDRWPVIDGNSSDPSIARALGGRIYCNGDGVWLVSPVPTLQDTPSWSAQTGEGGMLIKSTESLSNENVYNKVIARGESTEGNPTVQGIATDDDPYSRTYIGRTPDEGGFGECPRFYTSQLLATELQAARAARTILAPALGQRQQVSFDSLHDPRKEPGDVGLVTTKTGLQRVILDAVTYDLLGGPLQATTRTTAAQPDDSGDEEGSLE